MLLRIIRETGWIPEILHEIEGVEPDIEAFLCGTLVGLWVDTRLRQRGGFGSDDELKLEDFPQWLWNIPLSMVCPPHGLEDEKLQKLMKKYKIDGEITPERIETGWEY